MWLSKGQGAYSMLQRTSSVDSDLKNGLWLSGDLNGNGKTDLFHATTSAGKVIAWRHSGNNGDRLFLISNGVGSETRVVYTIPSVADGAIGTIEMGDYPHVAVAGSGPLVTKIDTLSGSETFSQAYHYTNRRGYRSADWEERRALGFRWVKQIDSATGNSSITYYSQGPATGDTLDMAGSVMSTETRDSGGALWSKSVNTYEMGGSTAIAGQKQAPRVKQEESYTYNAGTLINKSKKVVNFTPEGLPSGVSQYHGLSDTLSFTTSTTYGGNCGGLISAMPTQVVVTAASSGGTRTTSTSYDSKCNAVSKTEGGQTTTTVYNVAGQPASTTDPRGATTTITYGGSGAFANSLVETVSNALGHTVTNLYDDYGRLIEERDANHGATGQSTVRAYDALHRPVSSSVAGQLRTKFSYPSWTETKMETLMPDGVTWRATIETRDGLGRLTQTRQQVDDGSVVKWAYVCKKYDSLGREIGSSQTAFDACQNTYIATAYDALGRVSSVSFPDGRPSVSYIYNGLSTTVRTAGDAARDVTVTHDARGRVVSRTEPESATVNYTYNDFDQVLTASVVGGGTITTTYDSLGRKQTVKDTNVSSASTLRTFTYKANGDLQSMADANGKTITYDYDILGRVTRRCYGTSCTSSNAEVVTYDTAPIAGGVGTMKGSVHTVSRPALGHEVAATQTNSFDAQGRHDRSLVTIDGQTYVSQSHYTALGSERCATLPDGSVIRTEPTVSGAFLKAVEYKDYTAGGECEGGTVKHRVAYSNYSPTGTVGQVQYFSGSTTPTNTSTYTYTPWGGVATAKTVQGTAGTRIEDLTYEYTGLLELRRVTDNLKAVYGGVNTDRTQAYRYDKQGRLIQAAAGQGASCTDSGCTAGNLWGGTKSYSFNAMGNLTNKEGQALTYDSSKKQQLTAFGSGKSYAYDANGNVTLKKNGTTWWRYTYNDNNMLTQVEKSINSGSSYVVVERNTFIGETRIKKDYMPNQSSARVQTYYLGGAFEVRKQPDGKKIHSTYLLGPTGRVASFTIDAGANPAYMAAVNSYTQYAAAAMLGYGSTHSIAKKVSHWVKGFAYSAAGQRIFAYTLLLLASGLIFLLVLGVRQWVLRLRQVEVPSLWQMTSARVATVTASALLAFNAGFIGCLESMSTSSSLVAATLTFAEDGHTIMAFKSLGNALTGDTTSGPPPGSYWMLNNHVGSNSVIVHAVNQGSATAGSHASTVNYFPYGEVNHANSPGQDLVTFKFTGQEYDAETSLYHYGARMYDPQTGRFLTPDTILPGGGKSQGFNRYMYVFGNPISYTDPTGHTPEDDRKKAAQEREAIAMYKAAWKTGECNSVSSCFAVVNKYAALWRSMLNGTRAGARDARSDGGPYKEKGSYEDMTGGTSVVVGGKAWDITEKEAIMLVSLGMVRAALIDGSVKDYQRTIHDAYKIGQNTGGGVLVIHAPVPANEWFNERDGAIHRGKTTVQDIDTPRGTYSVPVAEYYVGSRETQDAHIVAVISKIADAAAIRGTKKFDFYSHSYGGNLTMQALAGKDRSTHGNITHYAASPAFPSSALDSAINGTVGGPLDKAMAGTTLRTFIAHGGVLDAGARDDTWNPKVFSSAAEKRDWTDLQKQIFNNANISWVNFKLGKDGHDAQKLWAGCNGWSTEDQCN